MEWVICIIHWFVSSSLKAEEKRQQKQKKNQGYTDTLIMGRDLYMDSQRFPRFFVFAFLCQIVKKNHYSTEIYLSTLKL